MRRFIILFVSIALLSGCAALKKRQDIPAIRDEVTLKPLGDQVFVEGDWPERAWWNLFDDEQLSRFMEQTIADNPSLQAAIARVRSSNEHARSVRSKLIPHFSTTFEDNYEHLSKDDLDRFPPSQVPAVINQVDLTLNFEYEIDLFGKNRETYYAALGEARAQKAEMSQSYLLVTISLAEAYFNYQAGLLRVDTEQAIVKAKATLAELTRQRVLSKLDDEIALEKMEAELLQARESLAGLERDLELSKSQIKILMGLSPDDELQMERPTAQFNRPFPVPSNLPVDLLVRRPDLMMQIWKVEAASHLIGASRAAFFPNINLASFAGFRTLSWSNLFTANSFAGAVMPAINLPIFTGGRLTANLNQAFANFDAAVFDYNGLILKAAKEVADGLQIMQAASRETLFQTGVIYSLTQATDLTCARFQFGVSNYLEVLHMQLDLLSQEMREITIHNRKHLAVLGLIRALGGGYHQERVEVKSQ